MRFFYNNQPIVSSYLIPHCIQKATASGPRVNATRGFNPPTDSSLATSSGELGATLYSLRSGSRAPALGTQSWSRKPVCRTRKIHPVARSVGSLEMSRCLDGHIGIDQLEELKRGSLSTRKYPELQFHLELNSSHARSISFVARELSIFSPSFSLAFSQITAQFPSSAHIAITIVISQSTRVAAFRLLHTGNIVASQFIRTLSSEPRVKDP